MRDLVIMPAMAQRRESLNMGEFAEEAIIVEEVAAPKRVNHFIEANTQEVTLHHLKHDCITPVFSKDNELTINHAAFVETIQDAAQSFFNGERVEQADIRVSHIIKGRIPEAIHKPANQLLESDKTIYYERAAFSIDIPTIYETVGGNKLNLSIVGVRAYNQMNLYSKKVPELFRLAIGFKNQVCCNMCIFTNGYKDDLRVSNTTELYRAALELFGNYNPAKHLYLMQQLGDTSMSKHQFHRYWARCDFTNACQQATKRHCQECCLLTRRLILWQRHTSMTITLAALGASLICGSSITCLQELISQAILIHS